MVKKDYTNWGKNELIKEIEQLRSQKKYGLVWENKPELVVEQCKKELPVLEEVKSKEIVTDPDKPVNLLIEGDNYHALSVLNYTHKGKIDVIYIDPPYNTGNKDFIYNDSYVDREDSFRHSKWLSFMSKRLELAKHLLKKEGAIFISIDNNEFAQLKLLCDEIFGENNFIGQLIWRKKDGGGQADSYFVTEHEYISVYAKSDKFIWKDEVIPESETKFNKEDSFGKYTTVKLAKWGNNARREDRPKMYFPIKSPDGKNIYPIAPDGTDGRWRVGKERMEEIIKNELIEWHKKDGNWIPYEKIYFREGKEKVIKERSILYNLANTGDGSNELTRLFGRKDIFENPKPTNLIKYILRFSTNKDATILDFMAGSGTTGHAVLDLNREDKGCRKFILCTNNELNGIGSQILKNNPEMKEGDVGICNRVTLPRLEKICTTYKGNMKYFKTNFVPAEQIDKNKTALTQKATEMLCIKEDTFDEVKSNKQYKIFRRKKRYTGIIFDQHSIEEFKQEISKIDGKFSVYVFSLGNDDYYEEFIGLAKKVKLSPIPEAILKVYREIFKTKRKK